MAIAAIAAPPIASMSFQSDDTVFKETSPWFRVGPRQSTGRLPTGHYVRRSRAGANPTEAILPNRTGKRLLQRRGVHRIAQHSDSGDADLNDVAGDQRAYAGGRTGSDYVAGIERHHAGNPPHQKGARINHQRSAAGLAERGVDASFHENIAGIEIRFNVRTNGAESVEAFAARELYVALLDVAGGDVVQAGVAKNVGQGIIRIAQMRAAAADDDGEFAFVLDALGIGGEDDGFTGADERRRRLEKHERLFG